MLALTTGDAKEKYSLAEIAERVNLSPDQVRAVVKTLIRLGYSSTFRKSRGGAYEALLLEFPPEST